MSKLSCERIIQEYNSHNSSRYDTETYRFNQLNLNETDLKPLSEVFARQLLPYYETYFRDLGLLEYVQLTNFEDIRIKRYTKGQDEFKTHVDIGDNISAKRFAIAILYLNENNGYTEFPTLDYRVKPETGRLVIFPPTWMYPHRGISPTDRDKYIMMTCLTY